jgi:hypothetical protein
MGPFYSYNTNFEDGVREKIKLNDENGVDTLPLLGEMNLGDIDTSLSDISNSLGITNSSISSFSELASKYDLDLSSV